MQSREIDKELKELLKESERYVFSEYCKTCYQNKICCDTCNAIINGEPVHYLSAKDAYELFEVHSYGEYLND